MSNDQSSSMNEGDVTFWQRVRSHQNKIALFAGGLIISIAAAALGEMFLTLAGLAAMALAAGQLCSYWGTHEFEESNRGEEQ